MTSSGGREATAANLILDALWRVYRRPERPEPWSVGGNLPWDEPEFSRRMLREHLDESHGAATRQAHERQLILRWLWGKLSLTPGQRVLDVTCGPGLYAVELARRGLDVTGIDFAPAAVEYARQHAADAGVEDSCRFLLQDVRDMNFGCAGFDAALLLYGQLAVFKREEARALLREIAASLRPGGRLVVELLDQERVDKSHSTWWSTGDDGLWGDAPYLHLGERYWNADERISITRFHVLHLDTGKYDEIHLCDQTYADTEMEALMKEAGFATVDMYRAWDGLPLFDAETKIVYVAWRG
jgi:ubiquinone/menaquinone biosynthesis C-methylase UbiE